MWGSIIRSENKNAPHVHTFRTHSRHTLTQMHTIVHPEYRIIFLQLASQPGPLFSEDTSGFSSAICYTNTFPQCSWLRASWQHIWVPGIRRWLVRRKRRPRPAKYNLLARKTSCFEGIYFTTTFVAIFAGAFKHRLKQSVSFLACQRSHFGCVSP